MDLSSVLSALNQIGLVPMLICLTVCVIVLRAFSLDRANSPPLPPSPHFRLPIIGHLLQLNPDLRKPFGKFRRRFGDVYSLYMGSRFTVVISGYATLKEAFKTRSLFEERPEMYIMDKASRKLGIINADGDLWRDHRRFVLSTLKEFGMGRSILEGKIHTEAETLIAAIGKTDGEAFDPKDMISTCVANIICSMAFGTTFEQGDQKLKTMMTMLDELMKLAVSSSLANVIPIMTWLPGDPLKVRGIFSNTEALRTFAREVVEDHLKDYDEDIIEEYTSAYIKTMKQKERNNESSNFTLEQLIAVIMDMFGAGSETTTVALQWSLVCLVEFPEAQTRMYDVIKEHVGTERMPSLKDKDSLAYVEAFYMEVLRFCNLLITGGAYTASTDVELNGYRIPRGCLILPDLDSVMSDRRIWGDPKNFRPERFLNEDGSVNRREEFLAFFISKRRCVGEQMARMELYLFLSALVQNYSIEAPAGEEVSMAALDGIFGVAHAPKPFRIVARYRHAA